MKKTLSLVLILLAVGAILFACAEEAETFTFTQKVSATEFHEIDL